MKNFECFFIYIKTTSYNFQNEIAGEYYIIIYEGGITTNFKGASNYLMKYIYIYFL